MKMNINGKIAAEYVAPARMIPNWIKMWNNTEAKSQHLPNAKISKQYSVDHLLYTKVKKDEGRTELIRFMS